MSGALNLQFDFRPKKQEKYPPDYGHPLPNGRGSELFPRIRAATVRERMAIIAILGCGLTDRHLPLTIHSLHPMLRARPALVIYFDTRSFNSFIA